MKSLNDFFPSRMSAYLAVNYVKIAWFLLACSSLAEELVAGAGAGAGARAGAGAGATSGVGSGSKATSGVDSAASHADSSSTSSSSSSFNNSTVASPFLKHGSSYKGQTASKRLAQSLSEVVVLVTVDNWSRWALVEPEVDLECGRLATPPEAETAGAEAGLPKIILPGYSEMVMFQKESGLTGVCGVLTYMLEVPPSEEPEYVQVMFSVPYNLAFHDAYLAVGLSKVYVNASDGGLFNTVYHYAGPYVRQEAGRMVEYDSDRVKIRGNMEPDNYKPILSVQILPKDPGDQFKPGQEYSSPRRGRAPAGAENAPQNLAVAMATAYVLAKAAADV